MQTIAKFTKDTKESLVKKALNRGNQTLSEFSKNNNVGLSTISRWLHEYANIPAMKNNKNHLKYSAEKILQIVSETFSLNEEALGVYLRKNGLHSTQLNEWKTDLLSSLNQPKVKIHKKDQRDIEIKDLKKNLRKKDAALAEVSALLILQKKANLMWPSLTEDEGT